MFKNYIRFVSSPIKVSDIGDVIEIIIKKVEMEKNDSKR